MKLDIHINNGMNINIHIDVNMKTWGGGVA